MSVAPEQAVPVDAPGLEDDDGLVPYRLDVGQYLRMIEEGILPADAKVELVDGLLIEIMTKHPRHSFATMRVAEWFRARLPHGWTVREEKPFHLDAASRPEPDVLIAEGTVFAFQSRDPDASETALIVEAADSSYAHDRGTKWSLYAAARIPVYWIVDLARSRIEIHSDPEGEGRSAVYRTTRIRLPGERFAVTVANVELGHADPADFLPRSEPTP